MIFLLAANLGGVSKGFLGLAMFIAGLLVMNTVMTAVAVGLFGISSRLPRFQFVVTALTAIYSLAVGALFLFGSSQTSAAAGMSLARRPVIHRSDLALSPAQSFSDASCSPTR